MTEGALFVTGGIFLAASYAALVLDYVLTLKGLDKGMIEVGPLASIVVKKFGASKLPIFVFGAAALITVLAAVFGTLGADYLLAFSAPLCAALAANDIRNLILVNKK
jgi:hypothetical protein